MERRHRTEQPAPQVVVQVAITLPPSPPCEPATGPPSSGWAFGRRWFLVILGYLIAKGPGWLNDVLSLREKWLAPTPVPVARITLAEAVGVAEGHAVVVGVGADARTDVMVV
jgi:hypothetical protein